MGPGSDESKSSAGLTSALEIFPTQSRSIRDLFELDESFRGLCEDLADARAALSNITELPDDVREAWQLEYRELVTSLCGEIEEAISNAKVIHFRRERHPPKP